MLVVVACLLLLACLAGVQEVSRHRADGSKIVIRAHTEMGIVRRTLTHWKYRLIISDDFFVRIATRDLRVRAAERLSKFSRFPLGYRPP